MEEKERIGFAMTGSFCTYKKIFPQIELLSKKFEITPIMSEVSAASDTRFGSCFEHMEKLEKITGNKVLHSVTDVEPIGPKKMFSALVVAPCTGNSLAKIASGIADSAVTLAVKSHLRNLRPVVIAVSSNDGLGNNAKNIGVLLNMKNVFVVPFGQDDCDEKPNSLVADMTLIPKTLDMAMKNLQIQPILIK